MKCVEFEEIWFSQWFEFVKKELSPLPVYTAIRTSFEEPYLYMEKQGAILSFDIMAIELSLHLFLAYEGDAEEATYTQKIRSLFSLPMRLECGEMIVKERKQSRKQVDKKTRHVTLVYQAMTRRHKEGK
jgi:hypothetical protein